MRRGRRTGLGESALAWELSGSSHHSARPRGSADCPRIWSSGSGSRRSSPPHSNRTCWGKSHRFRICRAGQGRLQGADCLPPQPDDFPPATLTRRHSCKGARGGQRPSQRTLPRHPTSLQPPRPLDCELRHPDEWGLGPGERYQVGPSRTQGPTPGPSSLLQRFSEELVGTVIVLKYC